MLKELQFPPLFFSQLFTFPCFSFYPRQMPIFERPPLDTLAPAKDRWTPIYLDTAAWLRKPECSAACRRI